MSSVCLEIASMIMDNLIENLTRIRPKSGGYVGAYQDYDLDGHYLDICPLVYIRFGIDESYARNIVIIFRNLRATCWAFSQIIDLKFMITRTACDFGRSWGTNIMRLNASLGFQLWYIFPQMEDHPVYKDYRIEKEMIIAQMSWGEEMCCYNRSCLWHSADHSDIADGITWTSDSWGNGDFVYPMYVAIKLPPIHNRPLGLSHTQLRSHLISERIIEEPRQHPSRRYKRACKITKSQIIAQKRQMYLRQKRTRRH